MLKEFINHPDSSKANRASLTGPRIILITVGLYLPCLSPVTTTLIKPSILMYQSFALLLGSYLKGPNRVSGLCTGSYLCPLLCQPPLSYQPCHYLFLEAFFHSPRQHWGPTTEGTHSVLCPDFRLSNKLP